MRDEGDLSHQPRTIRQKPLVLIAGALLIALVAGTGGYFLGIRTAQRIPQSTPTPCPPGSAKSCGQPTIEPGSRQGAMGWYHSSGGRFNISVPSSWTVTQFGNPAEDTTHNINMEILPANEPALPSDSMTIYSQDAAPGTWEQLVNQFTAYTKKGWLLDTKSYTTQIAGYPAQVQRYVWKPSAPTGFAGEWSDNTEKILSINIGSNKGITVHMNWSNRNPQFESSFETVLSSLTLDR
jgi:hypothetical protein